MAGSDIHGSSWCTQAVFLGIVLLCLLQKSYSLECWECNSKYHPHCGEPFDNRTISKVDCNQKFLRHMPNESGKVCRKIIQKVKAEKRVIRGCGYLEANAPSECINRAGTHQVFMQYCHCSGDGCNAANTQHSTIHYYALLAAGAATLFYRQQNLANKF